MPWKETVKMNERMKFVLRLEDGEKMSDLCREYEISRKTGYKFYKRFKDEGLSGLNDLRKGPRNPANRTPELIEKLIIKTKQEKPTWGAPKIREYLLRRNNEIILPARSTIHAILDKHGLVKKRGKKRYKATPTNLLSAKNPNDLWCTDFKGQFKLKNNRYCYPLTITDYKSRFLLACDGFEAISSRETIESFKRIFKEYGLPQAIRSDNGEPFSSRTIWGLSKLSIWWLKLGIRIERIRPGHPEENGRHERMHRTLKAEATKPAGNNYLQQQEKFEDFMYEYNFVRPHQALKMSCPGDLYKKSNIEYTNETEFNYSTCDMVRDVTQCGSITTKNKKKVFISQAFAGESIGLTEVDDGIWQLDFLDYTLGFIDHESNKLTVADSPFNEKV